MTIDIRSLAVIGAGTMGSGIAALAAASGHDVLLLDIDRPLAQRGLERALATATSPEDHATIAAHIRIGTIDEDLAAIRDVDWICEAIREDLAAKHALFERIEAHRRPGTVVSTNTSGIRLAEIAAGLPASLRRDIVVTHFFNPVRVMRLLELIPGADTRPEVVTSVAAFCRDGLGKGVVHAKDTVNFIGNRIGCFFMLSGLVLAEPHLAGGLDQETIDTLLGAPVGLPSTGLFGLIDLVGLDIMDLVGRNLAEHLPAGDVGLGFTHFPPVEQAMLARGQLGRKAGGGFARVTKRPDGSKSKETFDLVTGAWRPARVPVLAPEHGDARSLFFADDAAGRLTRDVLGGTLLYAADLVPDISEDVVNVDRALRWGFAWARGPFELIDHLGAARVIAWLEREGRPLPKMLALLKASGAESFYRDGTFLGVDGHRHPIPAE